MMQPTKRENSSATDAHPSCGVLVRVYVGSRLCLDATCQGLAQDVCLTSLQSRTDHGRCSSKSHVSKATATTRKCFIH